jgi:hypothetical protein
MPYEVKENDGEFDVINSESQEVKATKDTREEAERLVRTLDELEKEGED